MKCHGNLWPPMISFYHLLKAAGKAQSGKRFRADVARFHYDLERELWRLHEQLADKTYAPGTYHSFAQEPVTMWFPGDDLFAPSERRRGLPIGNQTNQFFANIYLDPLDHFLKDKLGVKGYVWAVENVILTRVLAVNF
jgi:hypothetical protein